MCDYALPLKPRVAEILKLREETENTAEIAEQLGISRQRVYALLGSFTLRRSGKVRLATRQKYQPVMLLLAKGLSVKEVAALTGIDTTVIYYLRVAYKIIASGGGEEE